MNILFNTHKVIWKDNEYVEIEDDLLDDDEQILPILEMFCLSRCKEIIQGIKYSSYSVIASLIGKYKKITNFMDVDDNFINIFKLVLNINDSNINLDVINNITNKYII